MSDLPGFDSSFFSEGFGEKNQKLATPTSSRLLLRPSLRRDGRAGRAAAFAGWLPCLGTVRREVIGGLTRQRTGRLPLRLGAVRG